MATLRLTQKVSRYARSGGSCCAHTFAGGGACPGGACLHCKLRVHVCIDIDWCDLFLEVHCCGIMRGA